MEVQSEFMYANKVNNVWFDLKETNTDSESDGFDFKEF